MKKRINLTVLTLMFTLVSVFGSACGTMHCSLKPGMYGFELAVIKNRHTQKVTEKSFDDIFNDKDEYRQWGNLFSFQVYVNDDT